jgi:hypothetical protein
MTWRKREIMEMAREAGWPDSLIAPIIMAKLKEFAKLVREDEREALTPRCWTQEMSDAWNKSIPDLTLAFDELIRAKGDKHD